MNKLSITFDGSKIGESPVIKTVCLACSTIQHIEPDSEGQSLITQANGTQFLAIGRIYFETLD